MKKKVILSILAFVALSASAVVAVRYYNKPAPGSKILKTAPVVSENINIPYFIDSTMRSERAILKFSFDTAGTNGKLVKLGFSSKAKSPLDYNTGKAIYTLYQVYDSIYPNHEFINFRGVNELMKKYGLALGSVSSYIGEVPEDRLDSMLKFQPSFLYSRGYNYIIHDLEYGMEELANTNAGYGNIGDYLESTYLKITSGKGHLGPEKDLAKYSKMDMAKRPIGVENEVFLILAPPSKFKDGDKNDNGTYGKAPIKDPIVLAPVEGGYIIVTAW